VLRSFKAATTGPAAEGPAGAAPGGGLGGGWGTQRGSQRASQRATRAQWRRSRPIVGNWHLVLEEQTGDELDRLEADKDRVRVLLQRYGVLFRELLAKEVKPMSWSRLFRTMRLMELSGEIIGGHFFEAVPGIQFASPAAIRFLRAGFNDERIYWMNAADPASLCGADIPELKKILPERFQSTYIVFHGKSPVLIARKRGSDLEINVEPDSADLPRYVTALRSITTRSFNPRGSIKVRTINGIDATESEYGPALLKCGFLKDYQGYSLWAM